MSSSLGQAHEAFREMIGAIFVSSEAFEQCQTFRDARFHLDGKAFSAIELCGMLWNCRDVCPPETCETMELPAESTYGQVARDVSRFFARKAVA
jgi:hypothetical protein